MIAAAGFFTSPLARGGPPTARGSTEVDPSLGW